MDAFHVSDFALFSSSLMDAKAPLPMMDHDTVTSLLTPPCSPPGSPARSSCPSPTLDMLSATSSPLSTPPCSPQMAAVDPSGFDVSDILSGMGLEHLFSPRDMTPPPEMLSSLEAMVATAPLDMPYSDGDVLSFVGSEEPEEEEEDEAVPFLPPFAVMATAAPLAAPSPAAVADTKAPKRRRKTPPSAARSAPVAKVSSATANKRDSHNVSERHRRAELKKSFEALRKQVPEIADTPKAHTGQILRVTISYVNQLRREEEQHKAAKAALAQENARLRALIAKRRA